MGDVTVQVCDDVTFHCFHPKDQMNRVMWFKQTLGEKPASVASSYHWSQDSELHDESEKTKRFKVNPGFGSFNLTKELYNPIQPHIIVPVPFLTLSTLELELIWCLEVSG